MKRSFSLLFTLVLALAFTGAVFAVGGDEVEAAAGSGNLETSLALEDEVLALTAADGQSLIVSGGGRTPPNRPADPDALPEDDPLHWYDLEFAGWDTNKTNIPDSPMDGAIGKRVIMIVHGDHPWTTACTLGAQKVADVYDMDFTALSPNWDLAVQNQMVDQAINERPDMILLIPLDAATAVQQARKINQAGVPLIMFNTLPEAEAMDYVITWTGPDDFGQFRMMAEVWADALGKEGGVAYTSHAPGGSPYFARYWGPRSQLAEYAPDIYTLDVQWPEWNADKTQQLVSDWLTRFGDELVGICAADDSSHGIGIAEALEKAGRDDIVVIAAGNSKVGMDLVKDGSIYAITYQTAEGDGALAVKAAADWFNGVELPPVRYLPQHIITADDVDDFYPPQW